MASTSNEATVIGETILIAGNLSGDEDLNVLGRVEGSINLSRTLMVAGSGIVQAEVTVRNAIVSGIVVGNINASDSIEIGETGRLLGNLRAPRIIIVSGARVSGEIDMGSQDGPRSSQPLPGRTASSLALSRASTPRAALPPRRTPSLEAKKASAPAPAAVAVARGGSSAQGSSAQGTSGTVVAKSTVPVGAKKLKRKVVVKRK